MIYTFIKNIIPDQLQQEIIDAGLESISYIETVGDTVNIIFPEELTQQQIDDLSALVNNHSTEPSSEDIAGYKIREATVFGETILKQFTIENVLMGISQAGKTRQLSDYCHKLAHYVSTGSLYAAIEQIDAMILAGLDETLEPFITEARLLEYKAQIQAFLQS
jgi:hypothetical protein